MTEADAIRRFLEERLPSDSLGGVRAIAAGDELLLAPGEAHGLRRSCAAVRRASGAGRHLARQLCAAMGVPVSELPRSPEGGPLWPPGIAGSIAHDACFAAAAVASATCVDGLGIDIEPLESLTPDMASLIGSSRELYDFRDLLGGEKVLFSIKEAVFKAVHPRDRVFLDFLEVSVDRVGRTALTRYGRVVQWQVLVRPRVCAIAWW